jgi:DNA-directed RNA polymerase specialized sigma subunit
MFPQSWVAGVCKQTEYRAIDRFGGDCVLPDDLYWQVIEEMYEALDHLSAEATRVRAVFQEVNQSIKENVPHQDLISRMSGARDRHDLEGAIQMTQARIRRARAHYVRTLVVEEGLTLTESAKLMGISRQAVSALYQEAINESPKASE